MFIETGTILFVVVGIFSGIFGNTVVLWWRIGKLEGKVDALIRANGCNEGKNE